MLLQQMACMFYATILMANGVPRPRSVWCLPRSQDWWQRIVLETFTDEQWLQNFRMTRCTFEWLCQRLRPHLHEKQSRWRRPLTVEHRVALVLYHLASGANYLTVGNVFGVSRTSVCFAVHRVTRAIVDHLLPDIIRYPEGGRFQEVLNGFEEKWGFPQCIGAIDGTHIPITPPAHCRSDFCNRKGWYSVNAQCIVDYQYLFIDVYVGWPGRCHDARVFQNSPVFLRAMQGDPLFPPNPRAISEGNEVPVVLIGDPAYPLTDYLMKSYRNTANITEGQKLFNYRLSRARMVVEKAFGHLKGRWRILIKKMETKLENVPIIILACCVLHNVCEMWRENFLDDWLQEVRQQNRRRPQPPRQIFQDRQFEGRAREIRDTFCLFFSHH